MNTVEPIREASKLNEIKERLKARNEKYYMLFVTGINTGLRASDLLRLKVSDVKDRDHIIIDEQKTGKLRRFLINSRLKSELEEYIRRKALFDEDYLFQSRKGKNKPLSRIQCYQVLNDAARECGIKDRIGTHTMRKTFGYWHYRTYHDVAILQDIFNHSSPSITLRYIGINDDIKDATIKNFYI